MNKKINKSYVFLCLIITCLSVLAQSSGKEIRLAGPQEGYYDKADYIVDSLFTVESGKTMTIAAGSTIRFKKFAQAIVKGSLEAIGTTEQPVIFTSDNHRPNGSPTLKPAPLDWNGLFLPDSSSKADFNSVIVAYSTFGIDVGSSSARVQLRNLIFQSNGTADFTIASRVISVTNGVSFDYPPISSKPDDKVEIVSEKKPKTPIDKKLLLRIGLGVGTAIAAGFGAYEYTQAKHYSDLSYNKNDPQANEYRKPWQSATALEIAGFSIAALCAAGLTLTFYY